MCLLSSCTASGAGTFDKLDLIRGSSSNVIFCARPSNAQADFKALKCLSSDINRKRLTDTPQNGRNYQDIKTNL